MSSNYKTEKILKFSQHFSTKMFDFPTKKIQIFFSTFFQDFFHIEIFSWKIFFHLYQSEIFPGFQKSHLENRATSLKLPKTVNRKSQYFLYVVVSTQTFINCLPEKIILNSKNFDKNFRKNLTFAENPKSGRISSNSS